MTLKNIILPAVIALLAVAGCEQYDDSELSGRVDDLENRVTTLEEQMESFQTTIDEFTQLINQYKNEARIKDFTEVSDGYMLNFADGTTMHIKHGGIPELGVVFDNELQEYVWTANGNVIKDTEGNPVAAYIAPEFEVRDGVLGYTLANEWHEVSNGEAVGLIEDVVETDDGVNFILSKGGTITIPKVGFKLNIDYFEYGAKPGQTVTINYSLVDSDENAEVLVYPDDGFNVVNTGYSLEVKLPSDETQAYSGKVLVMAINGNGATSAKVIRFGALVTEVTSAEVINVSRHGGLVSINISSNRPYYASIQSDPVTFIPPDWLMPAEAPATKAAREDVVYYEVMPMPDDMDEDRQATVIVEWQTNIKEEQDDYMNYDKYVIKKEIVINQLNSKDVAVDKPMDNNGNIYEADYGVSLREGILDGGWTFNNGGVVSHGDDDSEIRLGLNGISTGKGVLTSPVFEDGVGLFYIQYSSIVASTNRTQHIKFTVKCIKQSDNTEVFSQEFTQATQLQPRTKIYEETMDINCSEPCYIEVSNTSTKKESAGYEGGTFNFMKIISSYYTSYKAE